MLCKFAGLCQQTNSASITHSAKFPSMENAPSDYKGNFKSGAWASLKGEGGVAHTHFIDTDFGTPVAV